MASLFGGSAEPDPAPPGGKEPGPNPARPAVVEMPATAVTVEPGQVQPQTVIYEVKQEEKGGCGNEKSITASFMTNLVEVTNYQQSCFGQCIQSDSFTVPKHKITSYTANESTICCCCTFTQLTLLTTDNDPIFKGRKKQHTFVIRGQLEYPKLDTYVYGPLAANGEAIGTYATLVNDNLMYPIQLRMDRDGMTGSTSDPPPYEPMCRFAMNGESNGMKTNAQFRDDAVILDYSSCCCCNCCKFSNHAVVPRFQVLNVFTGKSKCCCCAEDIVTLEQQNTQPVLTPFGPIFYPIFHRLSMTPGSFDKPALLAYVYGSKGANAQHGASHLIGSGLAKKMYVEENVNTLFK